MLATDELMENWASEPCVTFLWQSFMRKNKGNIPDNVDPDDVMKRLKSAMIYVRTLRGVHLDWHRVNRVFIRALFENLRMFFTFIVLIPNIILCLKHRGLWI